MLKLLLSHSISIGSTIIVAISSVIVYQYNNNYHPKNISHPTTTTTLHQPHWWSTTLSPTTTTTTTTESKSTLPLITEIKNTMSEETKMKHVLINIAMEAEATPFIEHLQLQKLNDYFPSHLPFVAYRGMYQDTTTQVTVITNGKDRVYGTDACNVGTIAAATITMMAFQIEIPDVYINAGTAGGFQRNGATIGDIYVVSSFTFHDRRIPIPGYDTYGFGHQSSNLNIDAILQQYDTWKSGICTTGDSLDKTTECDTIMAQSNATVKDMEAAAIAWVVAMYTTTTTTNPNLKFGSIKVITDIVDGSQPTHEEFLSNLQKASEQLQQALPMVLDYISSKELNEL